MIIQKRYLKGTAYKLQTQEAKFCVCVLVINKYCTFAYQMIDGLDEWLIWLLGGFFIWLVDKLLVDRLIW